MKEDILEQIASDYLNLIGYFTQTNIKYRPEHTDPDWNGKEDGVYSDIDVLGINPLLSKPPRVVALSCKSWQSGFCPRLEIDRINHNKVVAGRERWRTYRELACPKWGRAFRRKVKELTGESSFEYWTLCTKLEDNQKGQIWTGNITFRKNLTPHLRIVTLEFIFGETASMTSKTPANSELGRLIQLLKVAKPDLIF